MEKLIIVPEAKVLRALAAVLELDRLTHVVDIGANSVAEDIEGPPPYLPLLEAGLCRVTGFEPDSRSRFELNSRKGRNETYLPDIISDGDEHTLHVCAFSGWTSLLPPNAAILEYFPFFKQNATVLRQERVQTKALDCLDLGPVDFLKMDIQGGELAALHGGRTMLRGVAAVQLEMPFISLYEGQPDFGMVDQKLRRLGFLPHMFSEIKKWPIAPLRFGDDPRRPFNQLLEADMVYVRNFTRPDRVGDDQLKHLAMISHACYGSADLAGCCVALLEMRKALPTNSIGKYIEILNG